ncbi:DNA recombination and repair protein RecO [uncultured Gammaproteobacteria bacterium]|uniref:DNA repair protein RecO n=1 Tax=Bathymodiolus heckerae thiotrophic gill symbiont TaxID=1052212 RepID=UPI0010B159B5|nr:DNA repair protein RecO [Bathymodiolus heckerae thiotrophic gill symbiont]CAC9582625.1 DNA recombination and repair protein RecO [uncultured Gammaproteobacteria bacterium]CAC9598532.1 DNA recombination and repair protein RecO [uncultured Gammaproteobacteria bacterium]CAC9604397.1 DNA recombination and repair protein RecO [uncultured Gammaproteobacteria bacterium]CAC9957922.1 DNA recombination and repair protein RecO [uncultured Gammaproteobacteria bacterium]SHN90029.1 DNA recombination and 
MTKIELTSAFLIHRRAFKESSLLLDFFTHEYGKIRLVGRSLRKSKTSIQVFQHLKISYSGKGDLKGLNNWEVDDVPRRLQGESLILGMYVNELISRLLQDQDPHYELFVMYRDFVNQLTEIDAALHHWLLRLFENNLLQELGYGVDLSYDVVGNEINQDLMYEYQHQGGFAPSVTGKISGKLIYQLLADDINNMPDLVQLKVCRDLNRLRLKPLLGDKPLQSRSLFFSR